MLEKIDKTVEFLKSRSAMRPKIAIVLGTGLGPLADNIEVTDAIHYSEIPGFRTSTVQGHSGKLIFGKLAGVPVLAMQGRLHFYEGYPMSDIVFPVRVMWRMGIKVLMVSNAAGGLNPKYVPGDIMLIQDHINLFPEHPLHGPNDERMGPRFPDMGNAYDKELIALAEKIASENSFPVCKGVYVGTQGPTFETLAEYRYFRIIGGDSVGMSTVPEVIAARHCGVKCFGVSVVANVGLDAEANAVSHEEVQQNTKKAQENLSLLFTEMVRRMPVE